MLKFRPGLLKTDVFCVKLIHEFILAGIGNFLYIYGLVCSKLIERIEIFDGTKICGFVSNKLRNQLLIHGETKIKIISFDVHQKNFAVISECNSDVGWILATNWIENDSKIVTVSMNNTASLWSLKFERLLTIICEEKCIAYCAAIVNFNDNWEDLVILTGTVFSDLLLWKTTNQEDKPCSVLRLKGHKGVLFSICYNEINNLICTTSDDRSTIIWKVNSDHLLNSVIFNERIEQKLILHGHNSRIFNSYITENFIFSAGEDGLVNVYNLDGILQRKIDSHQGVNVWSVFCSERENIIISGGSDGSVYKYFLNNTILTNTLNCVTNTIKKMAFINDYQIIAITESGNLYLFDLHRENVNEFSLIDQLEYMRNYAILEVSICKNFCAIGGYRGEIVIYWKPVGFELIKQLTFYQIPYKPRIFSIHWLTSEKLLICVDNGFLWVCFLRGEKLLLDNIKQLPPSKERCTTCACALRKDLFAVGDRKGNIYVYNETEVGPVQCLKRAHTFMGVTNLYYAHNKLISLGKDSIMKEHIFGSRNNLQRNTSDKLPFSWLTYYHSFSDDRIMIAGFKGDSIVIFDYSNRSVVYETKCGGGHRSWDIYCDDKIFRLAYIKDNSIHTTKIPHDNLMPKILEPSYHSKEINTLISIVYENGYLLLTGGEDTTFRVHALDDNFILKEIYISKSHLSSIRTISSFMIDDNRFYIITGGGREEIIFWEMQIDNDHILCHQKDSYHEENEPENRIMDSLIYKFGGFCYIFAACSNGNVKVFRVLEEKLQLLGNICCDLRCILKISICKVVVNHYLITMATDGKVILWNVNSIIYSTPIIYPDIDKDFKISNLKPHQSFKAHCSGINSFSYCNLTIDKILFATGGDDNKISINLLEFTSMESNNCKPILSNCIKHCAAITGLFIFNNILLTTSIDQKILAFHWDGCDISLHSYVRYNSSIADIRGMRILNFNDNNPYPTIGISLNYPLKIAVYGKGIEILTLNK